VQQINRNIELLKYQQSDGFLVLELVNATTGSSKLNTAKAGAASGGKSDPKVIAEYQYPVPDSLNSIFNALEAYLLALGGDVTKRVLKFYIAFRRIKNFACVEFRPQKKHLLIFAKVDPQAISLEKGFTRDVSAIGHYGTGDLEITVATMEDLEKAKPLILISYEGA
jgi:predicted transport protein